MRTSDFIIGRRGDSLRGRILDKTFDLQTVFGPVTLKTREIEWIHFDRLREGDEVWLRNGDRLTGRVKQQHVHFRPDAAEERRIPRDVIHTVIVGTGFDRKARSLG